MLHKFFDFILRFIGYVPRHRERLLAQELILLEQEDNINETAHEQHQNGLAH